MKNKNKYQQRKGSNSSSTFKHLLLIIPFFKHFQIILYFFVEFDHLCGFHEPVWALDYSLWHNYLERMLFIDFSVNYQPILMKLCTGNFQIML